MATAAQAIDRISGATGTLRATVFRVARVLREADVTLWPQGSAGRGQGAHVEPCHLVNLALAMTMADPITSAPEIVGGQRYSGRSAALIGDFRNLELPEPLQAGRAGTLTEMLVARNVFCGEGGLGGDLERLIETFADPTLTDEQRRSLPLIQVHLTSGGIFPTALVRWEDIDGDLGSTSLRYIPSQEVRQQHLGRREKPEAEIVTNKVLNGQYFAVLGKLWADTKRHRVGSPPKPQAVSSATPIPDAPASAIPERETAASPARDTAALSDQPANQKLGGASQHHSSPSYSAC